MPAPFPISPEPASRRAVLSAGMVLFGAAALAGLPGIARAAASGDFVVIETFSAAGKDLGPERVPKVVKSDAAWKRQLSPNAYEILRQAGTEPAFHNAYWNSHADGLYRCLGCGTVLFDSRTKFHSGTGWPSFYEPISKRNVGQAPDNALGMSRIAVSCARCDGHLGHVFDDGPKPTGLRYCMDSAALRFVPRGKGEANG